MGGVVERTCFRTPWVFQFVELTTATSPYTSDLEKAYPRLEIITSKDINLLKIDNLETFFVLANLQIPVKSPLQCKNKVVYLEENN